jgi:DNA (cytosine-5)-methyltransferase 1
MTEYGLGISLFSGCGGLDHGVENAGFTIGAAVEYNRDAADTMEKNFSSLISPVIRENIMNVPTKKILTAAGLKSGQRPELLVGGPPCTPFSKSGFWLDWKRQGLDPDASLLQEYTRILAQARPRLFILENVYALTYNNRASKTAFDRLLREIDEAGYHFRWAVLNAADFGVAQLRPRVFIVGAPKAERLPDLPEPTHGGMWERQERGSKDLTYVSSREALSGVVAPAEPEETMRGKWAHLLADIPPGGNYLHYTERYGHPTPLFEWRSRYWSFLLKLDPDKPSPTIQAQPGPNVGPFHWENRRLRVPEMQRLFTYPDDFNFVGSRSSVQAQIGNSVPCRLAEAVALAARESL